MSELVDLVDKTGTVIKRGVVRDDLGQYPNLHMQIVIVILLRNEEVLVHARSRQKRVSPGQIDHVCGGMMAGETPLQAALREAQEETGITPRNLRIITQGVNEYNRYRYLLVGDADGTPTPDVEEVEWAQYVSLGELRNKHASGELTFVDGFFSDLELATQAV